MHFRLDEASPGFRLSLAWLYEGEARTGNKPYHSRTYHQVAWLIIAGEARVAHDGTEVRATSGEWIFPRPGPRIQEFAPNTRILSIAVHAQWPDGRTLFNEGLPLVLPEKRVPMLKEQALQLCTLLRQSGGVEVQWQLQEAVIGWIRGLYQTLVAAGIKPDERPACNARTDALIQALEQWPLDKLYTGSVLSANAGLSRTHFERLCLERLGYTPRQYLDQRRLKYASTALRTKLVKEVAAELGFRHVSTFSQWFLRKTGTSPCRWNERI